MASWRRNLVPPNMSFHPTAPSVAAGELQRSAPATRKQNRTLYSDGRQDYTPCIRSMFGRQFLITPKKTLLEVIMTEKIPDKPL